MSYSIHIYSTTTPPLQAKQACRFLALQHFPPLQYRAVLLTKLHCTALEWRENAAVRWRHCTVGFSPARLKPAAPTIACNETRQCCNPQNQALCMTDTESNSNNNNNADN